MMLVRVLFLTIVSLQVSGCIITPRFQSGIVDDYEPPARLRLEEQNNEIESHKNADN